MAILTLYSPPICTTNNKKNPAAPSPQFSGKSGANHRANANIDEQCIREEMASLVSKPDDASSCAPESAPREVDEVEAVPMPGQPPRAPQPRTPVGPQALGKLYYMSKSTYRLQSCDQVRSPLPRSSHVFLYVQCSAKHKLVR